MTSRPPAPGETATPGGRHRAPVRRSTRLRPLLVGLAVLVVVGVAALTATRLGAGPAPSAAPSAAPSVRSVQGGGAVGDAPAGPSAGASAMPGASAPAPAGTDAPSAAPPAGPQVLPGDPIPGPQAPLQAPSDVTPAVLRVPAIDLDVPLVSLGLQPDGTIEVPEDPDDAGWLSASAVPGRTGPAVLAGHVDSASGVAVFTRLSELVPGDEVEVGLSDGTAVRYVVSGSERYPKDAFPSAEVYGPAPASLLRLITCGGAFDRAEGSYEDNLVVYAVPAP